MTLQMEYAHNFDLEKREGWQEEVHETKLETAKVINIKQLPASLIMEIVDFLEDEINNI